jgi:hypothetical protein
MPKMSLPRQFARLRLPHDRLYKLHYVITHSFNGSGSEFTHAREEIYLFLGRQIGIHPSHLSRA